MPTEPHELEREVRDALARDADARAVEVIVEAVGPEIHAFLRALGRDRATVDDAFATFCEHLLRGIRTWDVRRPLVPWLHVVARNAMRKVLRQERRHTRARVSDSFVRDLAARTARAVESTRSRALAAVERARMALDPEDEALLVLRVDRQMGWAEIALVLDLPGDPTTTARLRKRFQRIKEQVRALLASTEPE